MSAEIQPCTRQQILMGMSLTSLLLALIAGLWIWLGSPGFGLGGSPRAGGGAA